MQITITGNTIQSVAALAAVLGAMAEINRRVIKSIVREQLEHHIEKLNEGFIPSAGSKLTGYQIEDRFRRVDARLKTMEQQVKAADTYSHKWSHKFRNKLTPVYLKLDLDPKVIEDSDDA